MARKTFISYKFSESEELKNRIFYSLKGDGKFYRGEREFSDDLSSDKAETIKKYLADMLYDTSVTIVILSPNMLQSKWMEWEIGYSLRKKTRSGRTSGTNGIVCVVKKDPIFKYKWLKGIFDIWDEDKIFPLINANRENIIVPNMAEELNLSKNYIDIVTEDEFLKDPSHYIENAFIKSQYIDLYKIVKKVNIEETLV